MSTADVILIVVSMTLAVAAFILRWQASGYAQEARDAGAREKEAYAEIERLRGTR